MDVVKFVDFLNWKFLRGGANFRILNTESTFNYIIENRASICRFGGGELSLIGRKKGPRFQQFDTLLAHRLTEILSNRFTLPNLLICVPYPLLMENSEELSPEARAFWLKYIKKFPFLLYKKIYGGLYGNTQITRPYIDFVRTKQNYAKSKSVFNKLKLLWEGRRVLIVEGEKSRLGVGNDLFADCCSVSRLLCPAENAWQVYGKILKKVESMAPNYEMILIALGPTATVLAYDLASEGIWAIDIGHVDVEYEWFINKSLKKESIKNKYVNEAYVEDIDDVDENSDYYSQIVAVI